jgi:hypothetical protein
MARTHDIRQISALAVGASVAGTLGDAVKDQPSRGGDLSYLSAMVAAGVHAVHSLSHHGPGAGRFCLTPISGWVWVVLLSNPSIGAVAPLACRARAGDRHRYPPPTFLRHRTRE